MSTIFCTKCMGLIRFKAQYSFGEECIPNCMLFIVSLKEWKKLNLSISGGGGGGWPIIPKLFSIDCLSVTSHTLPHTASGSYQGPETRPTPPTTRHPVVQAPTIVKGGCNMVDFIKDIEF